MLISNIRSIIIKLLKDFNVLFLFFFLYNFCLDIRTNLLVCTFIDKDLFVLKLNVFFILFVVLLTLILVFKFFYSFKYSFNGDYLSFIYRFTYFSKTLIFLFFNYAFNYVVFLFNFYFFKLFNNLLFNILREVYYSFFVCLWYPIFRRLSYFGYFRSNRQKWIEINNENINRLKY